MRGLDLASRSVGMIESGAGKPGTRVECSAVITAFPIAAEAKAYFFHRLASGRCNLVAPRSRVKMAAGDIYALVLLASLLAFSGAANAQSSGREVSWSIIGRNTQRSVFVFCSQEGNLSCCCQ